MPQIPFDPDSTVPGSDTPRTDALIKEIEGKWQVPLWEGERRFADFARQLEREKSELLAALVAIVREKNHATIDKARFAIKKARG